MFFLCFYVSYGPMFQTDHCRHVSMFGQKLRWRSEQYKGSFDVVAYICSTLTCRDVVSHAVGVGVSIESIDLLVIFGS